MEKTNESFELLMGNEKLQVERRIIGEQAFFRVSFAGNARAINILKAINFDGKAFWTLVPEGGDLEQAARIGILIEEHYAN
jgi:hypothetical protein